MKETPVGDLAERIWDSGVFTLTGSRYVVQAELGRLLRRSAVVAYHRLAAEFAPYYDQAERMLSVVQNPTMTPSDEVMKNVAAQMGVGDTFALAHVGVFFGRDGRKEPGVENDAFFGDGAGSGGLPPRRNRRGGLATGHGGDGRACPREGVSAAQDVGKPVPAGHAPDQVRRVGAGHPGRGDE